MFRGPLFEPFAHNEWYLVNHMCQRMVELRTAAHTLRSYPTHTLCVFASWRETRFAPPLSVFFAPLRETWESNPGTPPADC